MPPILRSRFCLVNLIVQYGTISAMVGRRRTTGSRLRLGEPIASELADFCAVNYEIDEIKVIREAVAEHIHRKLSENEGMRREYEAQRKRRLAAERDGGKRLRSVED